jgi:hypothetical protein
MLAVFDLFRFLYRASFGTVYSIYHAISIVNMIDKINDAKLSTNCG